MSKISLRLWVEKIKRGTYPEISARDQSICIFLSSTWKQMRLSLTVSSIDSFRSSKSENKCVQGSISNVGWTTLWCHSSQIDWLEQSLSRSELHKTGNLLLVPVLVVLSEHLKRLVNVAALQGAHLTELKADAHSKGVAVLIWNLHFLFQVYFVGNDDSR